MYCIKHLNNINDHKQLKTDLKHCFKTNSNQHCTFLSSTVNVSFMSVFVPEQIELDTMIKGKV
jgi:hypothetical protein